MRDEAGKSRGGSRKTLERIGPILLILMLAVSALLRFYQLAAPDYWLDEVHSLVDSAGRRAAFEALPHGVILPGIPTFDAIRPGTGTGEVWSGMRFDTHPPFYFVFLHLWRGVFGDNEWALRFPSMVFSLLTILVVALTVRKVSDWSGAIAAAAVLGLSFASIRCAQDARPYALAMLLLAVSYWSLSGITLGTKSRVSNRVGPCAAYALSSLLAVLTHYFSALILLGQIPFAFCYARGRRLGWWLVSAGVAVLLFGLLWLPSLLAQREIIESYRWINADSQGHVLRTLMRLTDAPLRLLFAQDPFRLAVWKSILGASLVAACVVLSWRRSRTATFLLGGWCVIPLICFAAIDIATGKETLKHLRYIALVMPGLAALAGFAWCSTRLSARTAAGTLFLLVVLATIRLPTPDNPQNRAAAAYIAEDLGTRTLIIFDTIGWPPFWAAQTYHNVAYYLQQLPARSEPSVLLLRDPPDEALADAIAGFNRLVVVSPRVDTVPNPLPQKFTVAKQSPYLHQIGFVYEFVRRGGSE
ncbi:MAG: glycosyltransferase family 39 protein [Phycisphaerae bacterium]|nr:glycosyltransferase family 39 protein [Phycisphaerae bacterium]